MLSFLHFAGGQLNHIVETPSQPFCRSTLTSSLLNHYRHVMETLPLFMHINQLSPPCYKPVTEIACTSKRTWIMRSNFPWTYMVAGSHHDGGGPGVCHPPFSSRAGYKELQEPSQVCCVLQRHPRYPRVHEKEWPSFTLTMADGGWTASRLQLAQLEQFNS